MSHGIDGLMESERRAERVAKDERIAGLMRSISPAIYKVFKICMMIYELEEKL